MAAILAERLDSQRGEREGEEDVTALLSGDRHLVWDDSVPHT